MGRTSEKHHNLRYLLLYLEFVFAVSLIICTGDAWRPVLHDRHFSALTCESPTSVKQAWRTPATLIGTLVSIRESASPVLSSLRALECMFHRGTWMAAQLARGQRGS